MLVVGGNCRNLLIVKSLGDRRHRVWAAVAETALPHLQFKGDVMRVLAGKVWNCRRNTCAIRTVTIIATLKVLTRVAEARKRATFVYNCSIDAGQGRVFRIGT